MPQHARLQHPRRDAPLSACPLPTESTASLSAVDPSTSLISNDDFFKINWYLIIYFFSLFSPGPLYFYLDFRINIVSCMRQSFFVFFSSLIINSRAALAVCLHNNIFNAIKISWVRRLRLLLAQHGMDMTSRRIWIGMGIPSYLKSRSLWNLGYMKLETNWFLKVIQTGLFSFNYFDPTVDT